MSQVHGAERFIRVFEISIPTPPTHQKLPPRSIPDSLKDFFKIDTTLPNLTKLGHLDWRGGAELEYYFVYQSNDGALLVTKKKFTMSEFEMFIGEFNITKWEPIEFTGAVRG